MVNGDKLGNSYISGFGDGDGQGYGGGYGYGYGDGDGYGDGYGYGYGNGTGYGYRSYGMVIGSVGKHEVRHLSPWPYVRVGCKVHHVDTWRDKWLEIAEYEEEVEVSQAEVDALFTKVTTTQHG